MKNVILIFSVVFLGLFELKAQNIPSSLTEGVNEIKQEVNEVKTNPTTANKAVEAVKTDATVSNTAKLISVIKTKVPITASQETKIIGVVSKLDASKLGSNPKDMLRGLLGKVDFTKIFSSTQLSKLKALVAKK